MGPINYLAQMPQVDLLQNFGQGFQLGANIGTVSQEVEQRKLAQQRAAQYQTDVAAAMASPSAKAFSALALKYPEKREAFKQAWEQEDEGQRKSQSEAALQTAFALESGNVDAAKKVIQTRITALENSGADASHEKLILGAIDTHPNAVRGELLRWAAFTQDPEKMAENFSKIGAEQRAGELQGDLVRKGAADADAAKSEAETKAITAKYADSQALADLAKKQWDVKAIAADIDFKRESNRIAAMNAAANREGNTLKRQELQLKIQDAVRERDDKLRAKVSDAESAASNMDNMLNTIERIKKNPSLDSVVGSMEGRSLYPNATLGTLNPFGDGDERSDAIALIETLGSQAFLSPIPNIKGMGALSNAEGEKLQAAFQNLSRAQSEKQFRATLEEATRLLTKGRATVSKRYGVPLGAPDTPAAPAGDKPALDSFFR